MSSVTLTRVCRASEDLSQQALVVGDCRFFCETDQWTYVFSQCSIKNSHIDSCQTTAVHFTHLAYVSQYCSRNNCNYTTLAWITPTTIRQYYDCRINYRIGDVYSNYYYRSGITILIYSWILITGPRLLALGPSWIYTFQLTPAIIEPHNTPSYGQCKTQPRYYAFPLEFWMNKVFSDAVHHILIAPLTANGIRRREIQYGHGAGTRAQFHLPQLVK